jgi:hypothetical protein
MARLSRLFLTVPLALLVAFCGARTALKTTAGDPTRIEIGQLWIEPHDLESRDFFHGSGGPGIAPVMTSATSKARSGA